MNRTYHLLKNGYVEAPNNILRVLATPQVLGTIVSNFAYYGFTLSKEAFLKVKATSDAALGIWWSDIEPQLRAVTGDDKNLGKFVVYKNFPQEVLDMTESEYWIRQILMYLGLPNELFTQEEKPREKMVELKKLKVLHLAKKDTMNDIFMSLIQLPTAWNRDQLATVKFFALEEGLQSPLTKIVFKENLVNHVTFLINSGLEKTVELRSAMDVLRLAIGLSGGDITMKTNTKFDIKSRTTRRFLLNLLESTSNLSDDLARDKERWKKLLSYLHPGDYKNACPKVNAAYSLLYDNNVASFNSLVEMAIGRKDKKALTMLEERPGDFARRLNKLTKTYGAPTVLVSFKRAAAKMKVNQLVKLGRYLENVNEREFQTIAPKGNWSRLKVLPNTSKFPKKALPEFLEVINKEVKKKVGKEVKSVNLDGNVNDVKLQTKDSELMPYGRGTVFQIPDNITFIRSASYWESGGSHGNIWYDNGWNFFDDNWKSLGTCCWNRMTFGNQAAIYAGDPTSSKEMKGRAAELVDLYIDKLAESGVRYAVWNILCYSRIKFSDVKEVFGALQWGENPVTGKLFEPSRCQISFPLTGDSFTKYVAYIDVQERTLVYMDANLKADVSSAENNASTLQEVMPAYVEYLNTLPSVHDVFKGIRKSKVAGMPVLYTDRDTRIKGGKAFVFQPSNEQNKFEQVNMSNLLGL